MPSRPGVTLINAFRQLSLFGVIALIALRIGIGVHFYTEGIKKVRDPRPFSEPFFRSAKGRFASLYRSLVWDADGLARLDGKATEASWERYRERAANRYGLNENQRKQAQRAYERRLDQLNTWLADNKSDIQEYKQGLQRRARDYADVNRVEVAALKGQLDKLAAELDSKRRELTGPIDQLWQGYPEDLHRIGGAPAGGPLRITKPGRRWIDSESIDSVVRYFDIAIGVLLFLGLFTRVAATLGALFLCSVIASQWPGSPGAIPVWSQLIEALGLFVLAATGAGRFAGLDFVIGSFRQWRNPSG